MSILTDFFVFQNRPKEAKSPDFIHGAYGLHVTDNTFRSCKFQRRYNYWCLHYRQPELRLILAYTKKIYSALATGGAIESLGAQAILA